MSAYFARIERVFLFLIKRFNILVCVFSLSDLGSFARAFFRAFPFLFLAGARD